MEYDAEICRERLCELADVLGVPKSKLPVVAKLADGIVIDVHAPDAIDKMRAELDKIFTEVPALKMNRPSSWR